MSAEESLSQKQFSNTPVSEQWQSSPEHHVTYYPSRTGHFYVLHKGNEFISNLSTSHTGEIEGVETHPKMRRQGLATELLNAAHEHAETTPGIPTPRFSRTRTADGDKFQKSAAKKLGGEAPTEGNLLSPRQMTGRMLSFE
jgi:GNAT superfamily N-acetyltransferase